MANYDQDVVHGRARTADMSVDAGLRAYMLGVYNYMGMGLAITGLTAFVLAQLSFVFNDQGSLVGLTGLGQALYGSPLKWVIMLAPLGMVFFLSFRVMKMSPAAAQISFWAFAVLMGMSLATIFAVYVGADIARIFFVTAAAFGALSLWGYTTKRDISGWGSFLFIGLIGIILAMIVNIFLAAPALQFAISVIGVLIFAGLTAYDTQQIKWSYYEVSGDGELTQKASIMGALRLYLDFINMFMFLLQLFGQNRE